MSIKAQQVRVKDETSDTEVPEGWAVAPVSDIFDCWGGMTPSTSNGSYWAGTMPWISSKDVKTPRISGGTDFVSTKALRDTRLRICPKGSVLAVVRSGILANTFPITITDIPVVINQDLKAFYCSDNSLNEWLAIALRAQARKILTENRKDGTTVQSIRVEQLKNLSLPIPPGREQMRIAEKLAQLLSDVAATNERFAKLPKFIKRFRQAVLAAACSGKLTEDWRTKNPNTEPISTTIERIRKRREANTGTAVQKERVRQIYSNSEEGDGFELPDSWCFVTLNKLCASFDYGTSAKSQSSGRVPVLRMGNIQNGNMDWGDLAYTSDDDEIKKYLLRPDTVLFNRTNSPELVGKTALYRGERPAIFAGYLIRIVHFPELDPQYLTFCLNTTYSKEFCSRVKTDGVSQSNINAQKLGTFEVPYCSLKEQREIVRRVDALFKLADAIEKRVAAATVRAEKLTQSILAKAFRGELVPTEAELARRDGREYEPASVLLERIRKERETAEEKPKRAKKVRVKAVTAK